MSSKHNLSHICCTLCHFTRDCNGAFVGNVRLTTLPSHPIQSTFDFPSSSCYLCTHTVSLLLSFLSMSSISTVIPASQEEVAHHPHHPLHPPPASLPQSYQEEAVVPPPAPPQAEVQPCLLLDDLLLVYLLPPVVSAQL